MIPKPIYEALPFCYFFAGSALWLYSDSPTQIIAGVLLFCASALQWIFRTNYRRRDRVAANIIGRTQNQKINPKNRLILPRWLYEVLPFSYIALGYILSNLTQLSQWQLIYSLDLALLSSFMLCTAGFLVLLLRGVHRLAKMPVEVFNKQP
ncbi:MAG: hypothetical protein OQK12_00265 [Motiliproteus sp.]|nr:hypothetical protein [Motiliproteus sp.]MCW9051715.1 hypothetical protein [Motiliproteus sp.]